MEKWMKFLLIQKLIQTCQTKIIYDEKKDEIKMRTAYELQVQKIDAIDIAIARTLQQETRMCVCEKRRQKKKRSLGAI